MKDQIIRALPGDHPWQNQIHWFDSIDSTNTRAKEMASAGAPHGTVLIADRQTAGRGRLGRRFQSPGGQGIYMSVILRPNCRPDQLMHLTCAAAVAMCDAVEAAVGLRPGIKWTNDLVYSGRKLAGILTELRISSTGLVDYAVAGIGINCLQQLTDFPADIRGFAGSLKMAASRDIDRSSLAAEMINALHRMDGSLTAPAPLMARYRRDCVTLARDISLVRGESVRHAHALDVDDQGALLVRFPDGSIEAVSSGEVSVRGMYGYL